MGTETTALKLLARITTLFSQQHTALYIHFSCKF